MKRPKRSLPLLAATQPGRKWRVARRLTQALAFVAILIAPFLGGWQRLDRNYLAAWDGHGWDLPSGLLDELPLGEAPGRAYELNELLGGGVAASYLEIPMMDPVAGVLALATSEWTWLVLLAWGLPVLLGLLAGRAFCGWFCPFGTLARASDWLLRRLPWSPPRFAIPERRWLRWGLLGLSVAAGLLATRSLLYFLLPHLAVQQSAYSIWLMGGGGAVLGWLLGLLAAGVLLGPTTYCATLCPTGAALSLAGRRRPIRVTIDQPSACGTHCQLCSTACWLSLDPASGDPGPDCDGCARCFRVCPSANLRVGIPRRSRRGRGKLVAAAALALSLGAADARGEATREAPRETPKPGLVLDAVQWQGDVRVAVAVVDLSGVRLDPDDPRELSGVRVSVAVARGPRGKADERGKLALRDAYTGPLTLRLRASGEEAVVRFDEANAPQSAARRRVYRRQLEAWPEPGDELIVDAIPGWTERPVGFAIADSPGSWNRVAPAALVGFLVFAGLLSVALAIGKRPSA